MSTLVALVEEPSAAFFLKAVMPSVLPEGVMLQGKLLGTAEQKLKWSRMISPQLALDGSNRSHSCNTLIIGVRKMFSTYVADPTRCDG